MSNVERSRKRLVAILAAPPTTSGFRTINRVSLATTLLGYETWAIANLFSEPTYRTTDISRLGIDEDSWNNARPSIEAELSGADGVLLAFGIGEPTGRARAHHRDQVAWLLAKLVEIRIPVFLVGGSSRHPSRWHRWTSKMYPDLAFSDALLHALGEIQGEHAANLRTPASIPRDGHPPLSPPSR